MARTLTRGASPDRIFSIEAARPTEFSLTSLATFTDFVLSAGEVAASSINTALLRAHWLIAVRDGRELIATAALKSPSPDYRRRIFALAGASRNPDEFDAELGWVHVAPDARRQGLFRRMAAEAVLLLGDAPAYATTTAGNGAVLRVLGSLGFEVTGRTFDGRQERRLQLLVRDGTSGFPSPSG